MTGSTANFPVCLWRSAPIPVLNDPAVGRRALLAMSEHSGARAAQTAGRAALGAWDGRSAGRGWPARGARAGCPMDRHGSPQADLVIDSDVDLQNDHMGALGGTPISLQKSPEPRPRKGPSHAKPTTDHETRRPDPGIARSQRDRAQNPVNTTRTCNKLLGVYM